ncbi:MATE family efflux transporter [bacterium]|nr:MATE family efflux transporter [bacterium]
MKSKEISSIFEGPIMPTALKIGMPIMIGNLVQMLYQGVDTFFISLIDKSSTALLSGTGLLFPVFFIFMAISTSISIGISAMTGRAIGEKNIDAAKHICASGLLIAICIGLPAIAIGFLFKQNFIELLAGSELSSEAIQYGLDYFIFILPALAIMVLVHSFAGILQGEGLTGEIAKAMILSTLVNIVLDPLFIFGLDMGVVGAGLATSIATVVAGLYLIRVMLSGKTTTPITFNITQADLKIIKEVFRIGFPQFVNMATISIAIMLLNKMVGNIGEHYMNAWAIVGRMDQILIIPAIAVGGATITMMSQNYGRKNPDRIRAIYKSNLLLVSGLILIAVVFYNLVAPTLFSAFSSIPEVINAAVLQVRYTAITFIGIGFAICSSSSFQATAKPYPAMVISIVRMGVVTIPLAFLFVRVFDLAMNGIYLSLAIGNLCVIPFAYFWTIRHLNKIKFIDILPK